MVDHEQNGNTAAPLAAPAIAPLTPRGAARRRIAGLGVSGVVMTVASSNAMALVCKSPSGALSGNLNSHRPTVTCAGVSPGYWKNHAEDWPSELLPADLFSKVFACLTELGAFNCMAVLGKPTASDGSNLDKQNVAAHILATYLNVCTGRITFLSRQAVLNMWNQIHTTGVYVPATGALPWTREKLVDYLSSTQG
ncbi:MAG: hypothetical protein V4631_05500 [Pseudomonadota bacterium]